MQTDTSDFDQREETETTSHARANGARLSDEEPGDAVARDEKWNVGPDMFDNVSDEALIEIMRFARIEGVRRTEKAKDRVVALADMFGVSLPGRESSRVDGSHHGSHRAALPEPAAIASSPKKPRRPAKPKAAKGGRRHRRSTEELKACVETIVACVKKHKDGIGAEKLRAELGIGKAELPRALEYALEGKQLRSTGHKRATKYFVGKGA